jgi:hypothetical protein
MFSSNPNARQWHDCVNCEARTKRNLSVVAPNLCSCLAFFCNVKCQERLILVMLAFKGMFLAL